MRPADGDSSLAEHLAQAAKTGGHLIPELEGPPWPAECDYIWNLWLEMKGERESGMSIQALKVRDIMGYANAYGLHLKPFEIDLLLCIDREYVKAHGHSKS